jgi:hypothetical protein
MGKDIVLHHAPPSDRLHPLIYKLAIGFVLCFVVSAWIFFDRQGDASLMLAVASYLLLVAVLLPLIMWRAWRKHTRPVAGHTMPFRNWIAGEFETQESRLRGSHAAIDMLLPLAAVGLGLLAMGNVFALTPG